MFKKMVFESSEMVFLADDTFPYGIFYSNSSFEKQIGNYLEENSLVGLGLDVSSYIFKEEVFISFQGKDYIFQLELPEENGTDFFVFYKGKETDRQVLPEKQEIKLFFDNSLDIIAIGQENFLTWINEAVLSVLGYEREELINENICQLLHPDDAKSGEDFLRNIKKQSLLDTISTRMKSKSGEYVWIDWKVKYTKGKYYGVGRDVTKEKEIQEAREWQNQLYRLGEKVAKLGVYEINPHDKSVHWSSELSKILGTTYPNPISLEAWQQYFEGKDRERFSTAINHLLKDGKSFDIKLQVKAGEEEVKWVRILGNVEIKSGVVLKGFGTFQDITSEEETNAELGIFKEMFDHSPDAIQIINPGGRIQFLNMEAKRRLQLKNFVPGQLHIGEVEPVFAEKSSWESHKEQLRKYQSLLIQGSHKKSDGSEFPIETSVNLIEVQGKEFILAFSRDISKRVKLEKSLQETSEFLKRLADQVPGALYQFVLNEEGKMEFAYLSPGIKSVLDLGEDEYRHFNDISFAISKIYPEDLPHIMITTVASAKKMEPWNCQFRVKKGDSFKWVMAAARPELQESGNVVWYGYITDISELKNFEYKLEKAKLSAEKANQIKSEFLSMISHELRTPLNAIAGSVYSLLQDDHSDTQKTSLNTINFAVDNLIIMINDLLDFQKIEAGKLSLEYHPVNMRVLVEQVVKGLEFHAKDTGNTLTLHHVEELDIEVKADKVRVAQILNNLITNALKFTQKGQVDVRVKILNENENRARCYFEVKDSGIGIAKENHHKIFNDFDQVRHSFSKKYGGTGLGLSITKKLLERMGSKIEFDSELGKGSVFFFELDLEKVPKSSEGNKPAGIDPSKKVNKLKLLMAEDNDVNALVLGKILRKWGHEYDRVENGQEAVEAVKKNKYDLILMDIQMPIMNGFEASQVIKKTVNVPIIALTAASKLEIIQQIDLNEFDGFISKPIDGQELHKKIFEILQAANHNF
ncbi:PAS domain-containing hybrid sensor histidine kinase/response regulator [Pararhodonellum marinum]|uniref:PAS domain-containing hybrid sensor histidine kinase/response regulator n=1 Tax=Pararhodonellum marinum TaxID=2755358 RepID=UPI001E31658A|nr:PAS domain-containing hybrid sensor histidine kinase/response regulator [Pararhodonellum marinum]